MYICYCGVLILIWFIYIYVYISIWFTVSSPVFQPKIEIYGLLDAKSCGLLMFFGCKAMFLYRTWPKAGTVPPTNISQRSQAFKYEVVSMEAGISPMVTWHCRAFQKKKETISKPVWTAFKNKNAQVKNVPKKEIIYNTFIYIYILYIYLHYTHNIYTYYYYLYLFV